MFKKDTWILILGCLIFLLLTEPVRSDETWNVIRSEKIYKNVEVKTETGRVYKCSEVSDHSDAIGKAMILALAGSMIDSEHAILGAFSALILSDTQVRKICYDEIEYDTRIEKKYVYTLITLSNGEIETTQKIYE
jgi:hypothetical protein